MENLLMQIFLFHQYYDDGIMQKMCLQPDHKTQAFFDRYRLIFKQNQSVYALHYFGQNTTTAFTQSLSHLLTRQPLIFNILNSDDYFAIITDLPLNWCGQLQYSSNQVENLPESKQPSEQSQTVELTMQLQARTTALGSIIGQIAIFPEDLLTVEGKMSRPSFAIKMKARLTHWHYYVFNRSQIKLVHPVVRNTQGIEFEPPISTFKNGEEALLFRSGERTFALCETFKTPFNLVDFMTSYSDSRSNVKQLITGLPIPSTDALSVEMHNRHQYVYSPMYVYI
jgi:hypothetical protein